MVGIQKKLLLWMRLKVQMNHNNLLFMTLNGMDPFRLNVKIFMVYMNNAFVW